MSVFYRLLKIYDIFEKSFFDVVNNVSKLTFAVKSVRILIMLTLIQKSNLLIVSVTCEWSPIPCIRISWII